MSRFPTTRMRRLRHLPSVRALVCGTTLIPGKLILPLFVRDGDLKGGTSGRIEIGSMPGVYQLSLDAFTQELPEIESLGLGGVILFGIPSEKDAKGAAASRETGIVQRAVKAAKQIAPKLLVMTDVCFCEYTDHGHCGVVNKKHGELDVDNDATLELLGQQAVSHVAAGADIVAPSGMMDGMVGHIRAALDKAGHTHVPLMSYAAKYASAFYGPFREAAESAPQFGDRRSYQMDPSAAQGQALREVELDVAEGADIVMVKPAMAYLDVLLAVRERFPGVPLAAYNVSGEYSMIKAAAARGWIDERAAVLESLTAMHRAGADMVLTYWAKDVARWLSE